MSARSCFLGALMISQPFLALAQERNNNWIFGEGIWADFNFGAPVIHPPGQIEFSSDPHAVMSDTSGTLLFYFDGRAYYDALMDTMPHGIPDSLGLPFWLAQTQSIAMPRPGWPDRYYVFIVDQYLWSGYVEVDMTANGGLGDVISPNIVYLMDSAAERIGVTRHTNGEDYWIVFHERGSDEFHCFQLGAAGVDPVPVVSHAGTSIQIGAGAPDRYGRLQFNTQGDLLVHTSSGHYLPDSAIVELFHFDQDNGTVSLAAQLPHYTAPTGVEFSPDGKRLYCGNENSPGGFATAEIWQLSLDPLIQEEINSSATLVAVDSSTYSFDPVNSTMALAPDGKLYVHIGAPNGILAVINDPDAVGLACGFDRNGPDTQAFAGNIRGLPNQCRRYHDSAPSWAAGVQEHAPSALGSVVVLPNPAHDRISITWPIDRQPSSIVFMDPLGRIVQRGPFERGSDVSNLSEGLYDVIGLDRAGMPVGHARFIKH